MPSVCPIPTPVPAVSQGDKYMSRFSSIRARRAGGTLDACRSVRDYSINAVGCQQGHSDSAVQVQEVQSS